MRILVVDDDIDVRALLTRIIQKWGHEVVTAQDGQEAWEILNSEPISFVICDWDMPNMDGLHLCRKIRETNFQRYIYFILLTAKNEKNELITGMEAGADDFVVKDSNRRELKVRVRAGERILKLEQDLEERNKTLQETNAKLSEAYAVIQKDVEDAAKIQKSLLPSSALTIGHYQFDWIFSPCRFVAGDIFNFFSLDDNHIVFYLLDVAGHGIPAAMTSVTLFKILSPSPNVGRPLRYFLPDPPRYEVMNPSESVTDLNQRFQDKQNAMQYFTMVYGVIHCASNEVRMTQAGHPSPILIQKNTSAVTIGTGGFPVGMLPHVEYDEEAFQLNSGDRLFLYSDGVTECLNQKGEQFSEARLVKLLEDNIHLPLRDLLTIVDQSLHLWNGKPDFEDDVTLLAIEKR